MGSGAWFARPHRTRQQGGTPMARTPYTDAFEYFIGARIRARLVRRLVTSPNQWVYLRDLHRGLHTGMGVVQRELATLQALGLVSPPYRRAGACFYRIDPQHPLYRPLRDLAFFGAEYEAPFRCPSPIEEREARRKGNTPITRGQTRV